uniref:Ovule protein n=1 Tax=Loa loa TaxID=7209 RepID=A0A1I7V6S7_LOALO
VEEIESVLENAFHAAALIKPISSIINPPKLTSSHFSSSITIHPQQHRTTVIPTNISSSIPISSNRHSSGIEQCKLHITSSVLLNRLFGKTRTNIDLNNVENTTITTTATTTTTTQQQHHHHHLLIIIIIISNVDDLSVLYLAKHYIVFHLLQFTTKGIRIDKLKMINKNKYYVFTNV